MNQHEDRRTTKLTCIKECEIVGIGYFAVGDVITDESIIEGLKDHPYFLDGTIKSEEK